VPTPDRIYARVRATMAEESTVDIDEHARLIAAVAYAAKQRRQAAGRKRKGTR